jgi:DNA-binding NarL/FixJ family response regulator
VVGEAGSVREALVKVAALQPDIVVVDVGLPDGDGIEVCRRLRESDPDVWCIVLTAVDSDETRERAMQAGARAFLGKRLHGPSLVDVIRDILGSRLLVPPGT